MNNFASLDGNVDISDEMLRDYPHPDFLKLLYNDEFAIVLKYFDSYHDHIYEIIHVIKKNDLLFQKTIKLNYIENRFSNISVLYHGIIEKIQIQKGNDTPFEIFYDINTFRQILRDKIKNECADFSLFNKQDTLTPKDTIKEFTRDLEKNDRSVYILCNSLIIRPDYVCNYDNDKLVINIKKYRHINNIELSKEYIRNIDHKQDILYKYGTYGKKFGVSTITPKEFKNIDDYMKYMHKNVHIMNIMINSL